MASLHLAQEILNIIWPVGSVYLSINETNPANLFGGTWTRIVDGFLFCIVGSGGGTQGNLQGFATSAPSSGSTGEPSTNTSGSTTLTAAQSGLPSHSHTFDSIPNSDTQPWAAPNQVFEYKYVAGTHYTATTTSSGGGSASQGHTHTLSSHTHSLNSHKHSIPYTGVCVWKRIA